MFDLMVGFCSGIVLGVSGTYLLTRLWFDPSWH